MTKKITFLCIPYNKTLACIEKKIPVGLESLMNFSCQVYGLKEICFNLLMSDSLNLPIFFLS